MTDSRIIKLVFFQISSLSFSLSLSFVANVHSKLKVTRSKKLSPSRLWKQLSRGSSHGERVKRDRATESQRG